MSNSWKKFRHWIIRNVLFRIWQTQSSHWKKQKYKKEGMVVKGTCHGISTSTHAPISILCLFTCEETAFFIGSSSQDAFLSLGVTVDGKVSLHIGESSSENHPRESSTPSESRIWHSSDYTHPPPQSPEFNTHLTTTHRWIKTKSNDTFENH